MEKAFPYTLIDLTHPLNDQIPSWEESCGFKQEIVCDYSASSETSFRVHHLSMNAGIGTHMDAPAHCIKGGKSIDQLPLSDLILPCVVIAPPNAFHPGYSLSTKDIEQFEDSYGPIEKGSFIALSTGWESLWYTPEKYRNNYLFPSVSSEAAELLLQRGISGLGIDTLSPDRPESGFKVHQLLLGSGLFILENIANLAKLPRKGSFILALPLNIQGGTESPIRLVALVPSLGG